MFKFCFILGGFLLLFSSCTKQDPELIEKTPLVQVFEDVLYVEDCEKVFSGHESPEDSAQLVNAYIDRWIRDKVVLNEARKQLNDQGSITELVESYRNSLIIHQFEEQIVNSMLDTVLDQKSIETYFLEHEKDFILNNDIYEVSAIISKEKLDKDKLKSEFEDEGDTLSSRWVYRYDFIEEAQLQLIMESLESNISLNKVMEHEFNDGNKIYLYVHKKIDSQTVAPLKFVEKHVKKLILHKRKIALLEKIKDQQYREAIKKKRVKYY